MSSEADRLSSRLSSDVEASIVEEIRSNGVDVDCALLTALQKKRPVLSSLSAVNNKKDKKEMTIEQMLREEDPFDMGSTTSFTSSTFAAGDPRAVKVSDSVATAQQLAEALAEHDPFDIVEAIHAVRSQFSKSSSLLENQETSFVSTNVSKCDETCEGCVYCDGVEYIHDIRVEQNIDEYEQAIEEEDGGDFFETDDGLVVETDDDCVEVSKYEDTCPVEDPCWNPSNLSFWAIREEGKALSAEALKQKQHFNSSCYTCFKPLHCLSCEVNIQNPSAKKSASYIKEFAMRTTLMELGNLPCSRSCKFGKDCLRRLTIGQVYELRRRFFGGELEEAPKDKERKERAVSILTECYDTFAKSFKYRITRVNSEDYDEVCEGAFLVALGKLGNMKTNQVSKSWADAKKIVMGTKYQDSTKIRPSKDFKFQHAGGYIDFIANLFVHQDPTKAFTPMQTIGETSPLAGYGKHIVLPYDNLKQLHNEYVVHSFSRGFAAQYIAGYTTFSTAFKQRENLKFLGAKGSFNTCEICNSLNNLLKNTHKKLKKKEQVRIVQEFKRLHIAQQSIERKALEVKKEIALEVDDSGQPLQALLFADGMTELTGNTPKIGGVRRSKVDHVIANRVIGIEVYCGPINTVFLYNTDQMVGKGANTMIEVVRQAMSDLALELKKLNLSMPKKISWQFDNCGENKNKTMFSYASALVELGYFEAIDINFLIVGHTHSSIDQYFSVLSKAIKSAEFIGSPISLQALCSQAHKDRSRPSVNRQLEVCYNLVDAMKPYINKKIKFFQVPHCFSFRRRGNKCIMFYKLFSSHEKWLPSEPELSTKISTKSSDSGDNHYQKLLEVLTAPNNQISNIEVQPLSCFDGKKAFMNHIGISGDAKSNYLINNKQARDKIDAVDSVLPLLVAEEVVALHNLEVRTEAEEAEGHVFEHKELLKVDINAAERLLIQNAMKSVSTSSTKKGYIMWIVDNPDLPPLDSVIPKLIHAGASIHLTASQQAEFDQLRNSARIQTAINNNAIDSVHVEIPANEDDDDVNELCVGEESLYERTKKSYQQRAKDIVAVAKKALDLINSTKGGVSLDYSFYADKLQFDDRCWEDRCYIASEKAYFENRQSIAHYKLYLESIAVEALKTPWTFFLTQHIDEETLLKYQQELQSAKDAARAMKMYLTNLQKTGLAVQPGTEVIARDGYSMTTAQLQELQSLVDDERNVSAAVSAARRAASNKGRGRGRGRDRGSSTTSAVQSENVNSTVAPSHQSDTGVGQVDMTTGKRNSIKARGRGDTRSRGGNRGKGTTESSSSDPKRKRCGIQLCEDYCDEASRSIICNDCAIENRHLRFCSIHVPHISHSGQLGFIDYRDDDNITPISAAPVSMLVIPPETSNKVTEAVTIDSSINEESSVILVQKGVSSDQPDASSSFVSSSSAVLNGVVSLERTDSTNIEEQTSLSDAVDNNYNLQQKKVLRLFSEGFQTSQRTNISPELKIIGALDHSCYKEYLSVIATHYKLTSVEIPSVSALGKKDIRAQYLNDVIQAYKNTISSRCSSST